MKEKTFLLTKMTFDEKSVNQLYVKFTEFIDKLFCVNALY